MLLGEWINRLRGRSRSFDSELDDEIQFHMETRAVELEAAGVTRAEAMLQARREFGSTALACEESRGAWQFRWIGDFVADVRHAVRAFRRSPAFTLTAVLSLALGMGATTAIFTALDASIWRPVPVADPQQLVGFSLTRSKGEPERDLPALFAQQLTK